MDLKTANKAISPLQLKSLIEKIELLPQNQLGLMISDDGGLYTSLYVFKEGYHNFNAHEIVVILICMKKTSTFISLKRIFKQVSFGLNSKRMILDLLNSYRLLLEPNQVMRIFARNVKALFDTKEKYSTSNYSTEVIKCLINLYPHSEILKRIIITSNEKKYFTNYARRLEKINNTDSFDPGNIEEFQFKNWFNKTIWKKTTK